MNTQYNIVI